MDGAAGAVLDASALLAYLQDEPGSDYVEAILVLRAVINVVNYAEVLSRLADGGEDAAMANCRLQRQGLTGDVLRVVPLHEDDAVVIARLRPLTRAQGLSLGDRACLATGIRLGRPVITADRSWAALDVGVTIQLIRP
jgi:PIN domain nuclease of toxin-antitoxin system